jgi:hypothetical protein
VPAVYLTGAFLPFLSFLLERGMNNLRRFNSLDSSSPTSYPFWRIGSQLPFENVRKQVHTAHLPVVPRE